jgi:uncharacterized protein YndB with AHSA1/START domain
MTGITGFTRNSIFIKASTEALYDAFTRPHALVAWQAPGDMTAKVHSFDLRVGGGYEMSLYYPPSPGEGMLGKTNKNEDRFKVRFIELVKNERIVQSISFDSSDPKFLGEMIMQVTFEAQRAGASVTVEFSNIPPGIRPEDNAAGTESSLEKLAAYVSK